MGMENSRGPMVGSIKDNGKMVSNMERGIILTHKGKKGRVNGNRVKKLDGLTMMR